MSWFKKLKAYIKLALILWTVEGKQLLHSSLCTVETAPNFIMDLLTLNPTLEKNLYLLLPLITKKENIKLAPLFQY